MAQVNIKKAVKKYGSLEVVHGIDLHIDDGEFVVLVGPSGCGKSTTLRMVAGLEPITGGDIEIGDQIVNDLPPRSRNISMVFQNYALYPHMTVRENLGFSLVIAKRPEQEITRAVDEAADILSLSELMHRRPGELSGGQRQRVAMGRAIVRNPDVFLFDEPLSNLDAKLRTQMRTEIKKLHQKLGSTIVYVTHDQVEAMTLADRIVVMRDGYIEQIGTPLEVFETPVNAFVATFIGSPPMNLIPGQCQKGGIQLQNGPHIDLPAKLKGKLTEGQDVTFGFRADNLMPKGHGMAAGGSAAEFDMRVDLSEPLGTETLIFGSLAEREVQAKMLNPRPITDGETLTFELQLDRCHVFDATTEKAIV